MTAGCTSGNRGAPAPSPTITGGVTQTIQDQVPDSQLLPTLTSPKQIPDDPQSWVSAALATASVDGPQQLSALMEIVRQSGVGIIDASLANKEVVPPVKPELGIQLQAAEVRNIATGLARGQTYDFTTLLASAVELAGGHPDEAKLGASAKGLRYALIDTSESAGTRRVLGALLGRTVAGSQPDGAITDVILNPLQFSIVWHLLSSRLLQRATPAGAIATQTFLSNAAASRTPPVRSSREGKLEVIPATAGSCVEEKEVNEIFNGYATTTVAVLVAEGIDLTIEIALEEVESGTSGLGKFKAANALVEAVLPIAILIMAKKLFHATIDHEKNPLIRTKNTTDFKDTENLLTTAYFDPAFSDRGSATNCLAVFIAFAGKDFDLPNQGAGGPVKGVGTRWTLARGGLDAGVVGISDRGFVQFCLASCGNSETHTDENGHNLVGLQGLPQPHDKSHITSSYNRQALVYTKFDLLDSEDATLTFWKNMQAALRAAIPFLMANPAAGAANSVSTMLLRSGLLRSPIAAVPVRDWADEFLLVYRLTDRHHFYGPQDGNGYVDGSGTVLEQTSGDTTMELTVLLRPSADNAQHLIGTGAIKVIHASGSSNAQCVYGRSKYSKDGDLANCDKTCDPTCKSGITEESHVVGSTPGRASVDMYLANPDMTSIVRETKVTTLVAPQLRYENTRVSKGLGYTQHYGSAYSGVWDDAQYKHPYRFQPTWAPGDFPALVARATDSDLPPNGAYGYTETWELITNDQK